MNKSFRIIIAALVLILAGCGSKNSMVYARYGKLRLDAGEINMYPVDQQGIDAFASCCAITHDQIWLNRVITSEAGQYAIFIAVSETLHQSEIPGILEKESGIEMVEQKSELVSDIKVDAYRIKKNEANISRFVYHEIKSGLLILYDFVSKDESKVKEKYVNMKTYLDGKIRL